MNKLIFITLILAAIGCKSPEARRPISVKTGSFIEASVERNKKLNAKEKLHIEKIIQMQKDKDFIASANGFWYYYQTKIEADSLITPQFGDLVNYNYNVKNLNGSVIYSTETIDTLTYVMDKQELFTGLREGLKLMKTGEKITIIFPSGKAYGYYGDGDKIGSNIPLICDVTVNSITSKN